MTGMTGTLITVAPTGAESDRTDVPARPETLDELVATAKECEALGASMIRVHLRDADGRRTVDALRESTGLIVQLASGRAVDGVEMATCAVDAASHTRLRASGVVATYEITDLGQFAGLRRLLDEHGLPFGGHVHLDLVLGAPGGMPGTAAALVACEQAIRDLPPGTTFSATGVETATIPVLLTSLATGGHLRVGSEDTIRYDRSRLVESNMQLVARAVGFAQLAQRTPLTPAQARELLGVPAR
ncbi:3-keto-5-aminohexanoate cleavage protein [Actinoplanes sp. HUAS TT8]|uniref:3-keto-5-aminohexanoate cleavage protein n=1 Tax=Actinoplanes sp. HUAS TT8 TaxID=3447453 RepID=UPI003F523178